MTSLVKSILAVFALFLSLATNAEEPRVLSRAGLTSLLKNYQGMAFLEVAFEQTKTLKDLNVRLKSEGKLKIERPNRVMWEVLKPVKSTVIINGEEIRIKGENGIPDEVYQAAGGESDSSKKSIKSIRTWLEMDIDQMDRDYRISEVGPRTYRFDVKEKTSGPFLRIEMNLSLDGHLHDLTMFEISGDELRISFGKPKIRYQRK